MTKGAKKPLDALRQAGLKRTPVRQTVLDLLSKDHQPRSAPQILQRMPSGIDKVTLYRTLKTLTQKKLLHRVRGDDQLWRYAAASATSPARHEHAHFVCDECGTVECLSDVPAEKSPRRSRIRPGYRADYSEVLVHGACPDCRR